VPRFSYETKIGRSALGASRLAQPQLLTALGAGLLTSPHLGGQKGA